MLASSDFLVLRGHYGGITQMLFLPNGNLASCSYDGVIKIWGQEDGKLLRDLKGDRSLGSVVSMAALNEANLASGYADGHIRIWNFSDGSLVKTLKVEPSSSQVHPAIRSLTVLPGDRLAFSTCDNVIKILNLKESQPPMTIKSEAGSTDFLPLGVLSDGSLVSYHWHAKGPSAINAWNPANGELLRSVKVENSLADCFKVLSGDRIALGSGHGTIKIIDLSDPANPTTLTKCHRDGVWSIEELPNGFLVSGGSVQDAIIHVWDPRTGTQVKSRKAALIGYDEHISSLCVSKDGRVLASAGSWGDSIKIWHSFIN